MRDPQVKMRYSAVWRSMSLSNARKRRATQATRSLPETGANSTASTWSEMALQSFFMVLLGL